MRAFRFRKSNDKQGTMAVTHRGRFPSCTSCQCHCQHLLLAHRFVDSEKGGLSEIESEVCQLVSLALTRSHVVTATGTTTCLSLRRTATISSYSERILCWSIFRMINHYYKISIKNELIRPNHQLLSISNLDEYSTHSHLEKVSTNTKHHLLIKHSLATSVNDSS